MQDHRFHCKLAINSRLILFRSASLLLLTHLKVNYLYVRVAPRLDRGHRASTWTSSSSSLCLRALYRNIPGLLHASPGQTTVTKASTEQQRGGGGAGWVTGRKKKMIWSYSPFLPKDDFQADVKV